MRVELNSLDIGHIFKSSLGTLYIVVNSRLDGDKAIVCLSGKYSGDIYPMSIVATDNGYVILTSIKEEIVNYG